LKAYTFFISAQVV